MMRDSEDRREAEREERWTRLSRLLGPVHDQLRLTARRLARSRAEGDDLLQDTLLRAFDKLHTLRDEGRFRGWLYALLLSVHRNRSRRSFWRRFLPLGGDAAGIADPSVGVGERAEEDWRACRVSAALRSLPAVQREAVVLLEVDGFSLKEIAEMQKVSLSAVKSRVQRGKDRLRRYYERIDPEGLRGKATDLTGSVSAEIRPLLGSVKSGKPERLVERSNRLPSLPEGGGS